MVDSRDENESNAEAQRKGVQNDSERGVEDVEE